MEKVIIIGGGPAGSTMGCYLSMAGIENIIIEKAHHPRPHVGESLVMSTGRIFREIGFLETMESTGFVKKYGAAWHPIQKHAAVSLVFREFPTPGVLQDYTYHVDRSKLDLGLLKHAEKLGSKVYQGVHARKVLFDDDQHATGVQVKIADQTVDLPAQMVVDATGRNTMIGQQLGWKQNDPLFNQFAVHAWFEDVDRGPKDTADDIHIFFLPVDRGWAWQIPIDDKVTSIGVVVEKRAFKNSKDDYEGWLNKHLDSTPDIKLAMRNARRINELKVEADYSYTMKHFCGDGFLLVGDAGRFVDPIFSSGVSVAMHGAKVAARRIEEAFKLNDFSRKVFEPYEQTLRKGTTIWYEFIKLYYKVLPMFTYFIQHPKYRQQIFELLQGDVYDRDEAPVLDAMRRYVQAVEKSEDHIMRPVLDAEIRV